MKSSFKANIEFEVKTKKANNKKQKKDSWLKKMLKWFILVIAEYLIVELFLSKLVAWVINILTNGSFYFCNRMFYFEVKNG